MKLFLVTASEGYYPCAGVEDWIRCFKTLEEAREYVESARIENYDFYKYKFGSGGWTRTTTSRSRQ